MVHTLNKLFVWWLHLLNISNCFAINVVKSNTIVNNASEYLYYSEFETAKDSGVGLKNFTSSRARSLKCVPLIKHFEVHLKDTLKPGEGVGLTGDHTKLGEWQVDKSLEMRKRRHDPLKWYLKIPMCSSLRIYYRFFIYYKDTRGFKRIRYWEGQQHARVLEAYEIYRHQGSLQLGQAHNLALGGGIQSERGWLRKEYIIQLKFIWPQHIRFTEFTHFIRKPAYTLKLKTYPIDNGEFNYRTSELEGDIELQVIRFLSRKSKLTSLKEQGESYKSGDIVIFHITTADFLENWYVLDIYTSEQELLGQVVIPAKVLKHSEGILELPIFDVRGKDRVGWLTLPFLRIEALPQALKLNMRASFHHYWPYNWPTLDIGQRGLGKSYNHHNSNAVENTIESFLKAQEIKSDMIQLDVQLTKDYVPVVWHDFGFYTFMSGNKKHLKRKHLKYVHIHDLNYAELLTKRVFINMKSVMVEVTYWNTALVPQEERIFPQLGHVYQQLSSSLGIMVNIRWPQLLSRGSLEALQPLDKNRYVDEVLQTTMEFGCGRPLIMASFDADICTMLRFKQHMYAVVFLTLGQYSPWEPYADLRTHSLANAIRFVQASDILGTAVYAQEIIPAYKNKLLEMAFELQQLVFVWGDHLSDPTLLEYFRDEEVAGLIYNRIDYFILQRSKAKRKRFGFFEAKELQRIFLRQCIAGGNLSISEGLPDTHSPFWPRFRSLDEL